jgi:hypothetical protein
LFLLARFQKFGFDLGEQTGRGEALAKNAPATGSGAKPALGRSSMLCPETIT